LCGAAGYAGIPSTSRDAMNHLDPSTDTLINDVPGIDDTGTWRSCAENTTAALMGKCVSVGQLQTHVLGATPNGSSILVQRASSVGVCGVTTFWIYDGTLSPQAYTGTDITSAITTAAFDATEGQHLTLTPDGLTIIGRKSNGVLQSVTRTSTSLPFGSPTSTPFDGINAAFVNMVPADQVAISTDSRHLFFSRGTTFYESTRPDASSAFGSAAALTGDVATGGYDFITGAGDRTLLATKNYHTIVLRRDTLSDPFVAVNDASPLAIWYAHPLNGCASLLGTMSAGGCTNEGVGTLTYK
jgi:hypothetical protein